MSPSRNIECSLKSVVKYIESAIDFVQHRIESAVPFQFDLCIAVTGAPELQYSDDDEDEDSDSDEFDCEEDRYTAVGRDYIGHIGAKLMRNKLRWCKSSGLRVSDRNVLRDTATVKDNVFEKLYTKFLSNMDGDDCGSSKETKEFSFRQKRLVSFVDLRNNLSDGHVTSRDGVYF